jgi:tetratricopeptide (TPR) repeat protein
MTMNRAFVSTAAVALTGLALSACVASASRADEGRTFYESGNYLAATDAFSDDIRLHPRSADAWNNRGIARVRLGDLNGAVRDYNHALDLAPMDAEIYFNRGNAFVAAGHYPEAIADYDRAVQLVPSYARALFNRGTAYALANQPDAARRDWLAAAALEGDPYTRAAMRRSAGLDSTGTTRTSAVGQPTTATTIAPPPPPGTQPGVPQPSTPATVFPNVASQPAASPLAIDARALASRAISRELDGDRAGALQDLHAAVALEPDTARREAITRLIRLLDTPR